MRQPITTGGVKQDHVDREKATFVIRVHCSVTGGWEGTLVRTSGSHLEVMTSSSHEIGE